MISFTALPSFPFIFLFSSFFPYLTLSSFGVSYPFPSMIVGMLQVYLDVVVFNCILKSVHWSCRCGLCCRNGGLICGSMKASHRGSSISVLITAFQSTTFGLSLQRRTSRVLLNLMRLKTAIPLRLFATTSVVCCSFYFVNLCFRQDSKVSYFGGSTLCLPRPTQTKVS